MEAKPEVVLFWFRRDLRLDDNVGLAQALRSGKPVVPVFVLEPNRRPLYAASSSSRVKWVHSALHHLHQSLVALGSGLVVEKGDPMAVFHRLMERWTVTSVYANREYEPDALRRDAELYDLLAGKGVAFHRFNDAAYFEADEVLKADGTPYTVFTPYRKAWLAKKAAGRLPRGMPSWYFLPLSVPFPAWNDWGYASSDIRYQPPHVDESVLARYAAVRDIPSVKGTSELSVHLRFGTWSIRRLVEVAEKVSDSFLNELIWRDFFQQILYHFPRVEREDFRSTLHSMTWRNAEAEFERWCSGRTGYPLVDAGMRQLNATGWMHNRARMVTASFLVKDLLIDWRWGEAYFAEKLLDYDLAANNGNWQWVAGCGCDAAPYFRIFNPTEQARRFDPDFSYVRQWVPEWQTPDYPMPMVEHSFARARALSLYKR